MMNEKALKIKNEEVLIRIEELLKHNNVDVDSATIKNCLLLLKDASQYNDPKSYVESILGNVNETQNILFGKFESENINSLVNGFKQILDKYNHNIYDELLNNSSIDSLKELCTVPESLFSLSNMILEMKSDDKLAVYYNIEGNDNVPVFEYEAATNSYRLDRNPEKHNNFLLGSLSFTLNGYSDEFFDKIFINFMEPEISFVKKKTTLDYLRVFTNTKIADSSSKYWKNLTLLMSKLKNNGKMISIMPNACLMHNRDEDARKYFVNQGFIECVINLPRKFLNRTATPASLVVFSKNNENVKIVDATELKTDGRRRAELSYENINQIYRQYKYGTDNSIQIVVTRDDVSKNRYILTDSPYRKGSYRPEKSLILGEVTTICRPAPLSAKQIDEIHTDRDTDWCYLRLSDIKYGMVDLATLPNILSLDEKYEKYFLKNGDVVISKTGKPFKIAVIEDIYGRKVLPVGNMYIIRPDKTKVNPYFIKASLESTKGTAVLNSLLTGGTVQIITVESLRGVGIPNCSIEVQNEMEEAYTDLLFDLKEQRTKLKTMIDEVSYFLDDF